MQGEFTGLAHPVWSTPSGYFSPTNRRAFVEFAAGRAINPRGNTSFEQQMADLQIIAGTPKTVIAKLKRILEETRPGILALWGNDGRVSQEDTLDLHPADRPGGLPGDARDRQGARPQEPVRRPTRRSISNTRPT